MSSINFDNVWLLFIALPLVVLFLVPFVIAVRKDNANGHNIASMVLHVLMALLIAFAAAGTYIVTVITETDVYVVADVSYSANKNLDTIDGYIENLSLPRNCKLGLICFGKDYQLVTELGKKVRSVKEADVDDTETNISEALEYAGSLFKEDVIKRIVVITDGKETYPEDSNKLKRTVDGLVAKNIKVDAIFLDDNISSDVKEVQISSAEYTKSAFLDRNETVNVFVQTSYATPATVTLYKNGEVFGAPKILNLTLGSNNISFPLDTGEVGSHDYFVTVEADGDECSFNNYYSFTQKVSELVNVLLISSNEKDLDFVTELYGETTEIDSYINDPEVPVSVEALAKYDEILISDTEVTSLNNYELFVESLEAVVSRFGKSLLTFGELGIQNANGDLAKLDDILPIRYGSAVLAPKLYTIMIDVSHSMNAGWSRFRLAKLAAIQLINYLNDEDYVLLTTFSGSAKSLYFGRIGPAREELIADIKNLNTEQGTYMGLGLKAVMDMIRNSDFSEKQVMVITDGLPYKGLINYGGEEYAGMTDKEAAENVVETMLLYGIHTSVLQVGGSSSEAEGGGLAETQWLKDLAFMGGGSHYLAENEVQLGTVIFDEIKEDDKLEVSNTWITSERPRDSVLKNVDTTLSYVSDYVLGKAKASATEVLSVTYQVGRVTAKVPLYAYWGYGNGKAASYAGKINELKKRDQTNINDVFFGNMLDNLMPAEKVEYPFALNTDVDGKTVKISITPGELHSKASAQITVKMPGGEERTEQMIFNSSNYYYELTASEIGKYAIDIVYSYNGEDYPAAATLDISYEPEYDAFTVFEASVIYRMIGANGTVSEDGNLALVNDEKEVATFTVKLAVPLLITAVVLYVVDIAIRKLKWKDIVSLFGKAKGKNDGGKK